MTMCFRSEESGLSHPQALFREVLLESFRQAYCPYKEVSTEKLFGINRVQNGRSPFKGLLPK